MIFSNLSPNIYFSQDPSAASAAYINCSLGVSPRHSVTSPGLLNISQETSPRSLLNITQERPNSLAVDPRHEYENVGLDTQAAQAHSPR